jgi:hypothetical protein
MTTTDDRDQGSRGQPPESSADWQRSIELLRIGVEGGLDMSKELLARAANALASFGEASQVFASLVAIAAEQAHRSDANGAMALARRARYLFREAGDPAAAMRLEWRSTAWDLPSPPMERLTAVLDAERAVVELQVQSALMWWQPASLAFTPSDNRRGRWLVSIPRSACDDDAALRRELESTLARRFLGWNRSLHAQPEDPTYLALRSFEHRVLVDDETATETWRMPSLRQAAITGTWLFEDGRSFRVSEMEFVLLAVLALVQRGKLTHDTARGHLTWVGLHPTVAATHLEQPAAVIRALLDGIVRTR